MPIGFTTAFISGAAESANLAGSMLNDAALANSVMAYLVSMTSDMQPNSSIIIASSQEQTGPDASLPQLPGSIQLG